MAIFVDADACPVKQEVVRVAERHNLIVYMVSNSLMRLPQSCLLYTSPSPRDRTRSRMPSSA